ncbi:hypothetical protein PSCICL_47640 [Pseudomonas cichorii]|nr:hypothetical protein PSCICL_47640 [Pseudomonas cichorii]
MKPAKFALDHLFYPEVSVKASSDYDPEVEATLTEPSITIFMNKSGANLFHLGLRLNLTPEVAADKYSIEALAVGIFRADETLPEDQQVKLIAHSGPNLLFGGMRDMIATITGRGPWGEYYLQPKIIEADDFSSTDRSYDLGIE